MTKKKQVEEDTDKIGLKMEDVLNLRKRDGEKRTAEGTG